MIEMCKCIVCAVDTKKYKCPKCLEFYCSVNCYKEHKGSEVCLQKAEQLSSSIAGGTITADSAVPTIYEPFKTEDTLTREQLQQLGRSEKLQQLLENPHLRNFLKEVDTAENAWRAMQIAMQEPLFIEFADECLKCIESK